MKTRKLHATLAELLSSCGLILFLASAPGVRAQTATTSADFVTAVRSVFLHGNLADYRYTAHALGLQLLPDPAKTVHDSNGEVLGSNVSVRLAKIPPQFIKQNFSYYIFSPVSEQTIRAGFILYLDVQNLCVLRDDVEAEFGKPQLHYTNPHSDVDGISYRSTDSLGLYFGYARDNKCLLSIYSSQEFTRSEGK